MTEERKVITLDGVQYYIDSIPEDATQVLNGIITVNTELAQLERSALIANIARESLSTKLAPMLETFEKVPETK